MNAAQAACRRCRVMPGWHAALHVGHVWTETQCPAYRTGDGDDCTCARPDPASVGAASTTHDGRHTMSACKVCGSTAVITRESATRGTLHLCYAHEAVCWDHLADPCRHCDGGEPEPDHGDEE